MRRISQERRIRVKPNAEGSRTAPRRLHLARRSAAPASSRRCRERRQKQPRTARVDRPSRQDHIHLARGASRTGLRRREAEPFEPDPGHAGEGTEAAVALHLVRPFPPSDLMREETAMNEIPKFAAPRTVTTGPIAGSRKVYAAPKGRAGHPRSVSRDRALRPERGAGPGLRSVRALYRKQRGDRSRRRPAAGARGLDRGAQLSP